MLVAFARKRKRVLAQKQGLACREMLSEKRLLSRSCLRAVVPQAQRYNEVECSGVPFRRRHGGAYISVNLAQHRLHFRPPSRGFKEAIVDTRAISWFQLVSGCVPWSVAEDDEHAANSSMTSVPLGEPAVSMWRDRREKSCKKPPSATSG
jgi:hypothetical protein